MAPVIDTDEVLEKPILIVYEGDHESMDGIVSVTPYHLDLLTMRHNSMISKVKRLAGVEEIPLRHYPPLQVDHSTSAHDTVGRLVGELRKGVHKMVDGSERQALYGRARVLGRENVAKARDGRWAEVSIGADFDEGTISEVSFTPFPAATEASLLSKFVQGDVMLKKLKAHIMKVMKLSEKDAEEHLAKMSEEAQKSLAAQVPEESEEEKKKHEDELKAYLSETEKLSDDDLVKRMATLSEEDRKELSGKCLAAKEAKLAAEKEAADKLAADEKEKEAKLAADKEKEDESKLSAPEREEKKMVRLAAKNPALHKLAKDFRSAAADTGSVIRMAQMTSRLSRLRSSAKISPAEVKKIDLKKLSTCSEETINEVFKSYEDREPVIMPGIMGSAKGVNLAEINAKVAKSRLEAESRANMSLKAADKKGAKLSAEELRENEEMVRAVSFAKDPVGYDKIEELLDKGEVKLAKVAIKATLAQGGNAGADVSGMEAQLSDLSKSYSTLQAKFQELLALVTE
jgi:hypothetical protein